MDPTSGVWPARAISTSTWIAETSRPAKHDLLIHAVDELGDEVTERVTLVNHAQSCALPYTIKWDEVAQIQDVAHVVDGIWSITADGVSPEEIGYDRLIAIGDMAWRDYEVTVPITVHGINAACYNRPSVHAGVGIVLRWKGHSNWGADEWASGQPWFGPGPYGAISWYCVFHDVGPILNFFDPDFQRTAELSAQAGATRSLLLQNTGRNAGR